MWFRERWVLNSQWKKVVFWSPTFSHKLQDLSLQYSSSRRNAQKVFLWAPCSFSKSELKMSLVSTCKSDNCWTVSCLRLKVVLVGFLTQALSACFVAFNLFSHTKHGDPATGEDQDEWTVSRKPSFSIQRGLNLKGIGPIFSSSSKFKRIGLWSEVSFGRILEETILLSCKNELWIKNLSKRAKMWSAPTLLFV